MSHVGAVIKTGEPKLRYLTKSLVRTALKCPRKLVYATNPTSYPQSPAKVGDPLFQYLSQEGERFGEYCKQLFPHGVDIRKEDASIINETLKRQMDATKSESHSSIDYLVAQTNQALMVGEINKRSTVFEGAIRHGHFYVRPDILDKIIVKSDGERSQVELRLIEVKSKSWDSRYTIEEKMLSKDQKSIRALYAPYIRDVAFQSMVCRLAYPGVHVSSWLMMPDKKMKCNPDQESLPERLPTVEETMQSIDGSIATMLNVDHLVDIALSSEVTYPGSKKGETFKDVVQQWAEELNDYSFGSDSFSTPIGMQCSSCEYRFKDSYERMHSGFDVCWKNATGIETEELHESPLVLDMYGNTQKSMKAFLSEGQYILSDLSARDFDLYEDGTPLEDDAKAKKKAVSGNTITRNQRQWYQVQTVKRSKESDTNLHPSYIIKRNNLKQEMNSWQYPLHVIDFETMSPSIPYYSNMSPYEIFGFQFSHHVYDGGSEVKHASEFLHTEQGSPNVAFLKALYNAIGHVATEGGTIFQWSPHESHVLRAMLSSHDVSASLPPQEISALSAILDTGMVDLCKLAHEYYYVDGSGGSSSIKRLLQPTLNASSHLSNIYGSPTYNGSNFHNFQWYQLDDSGCAKDPYDIIAGINPNQHDSANITQGGAAASAFQILQNSLDLNEQDRKAIENSLLRYCELDTLAMVMIIQAWQEFLDEEE